MSKLVKWILFCHGSYMTNRSVCSFILLLSLLYSRRQFLCLFLAYTKEEKWSFQKGFKKSMSQKLSLKFLVCSSTSSWGLAEFFTSCRFKCLYSLLWTFFSCSSLAWCNLSFSWINSLPHSSHFTIGWWWICLAWLIRSSYLLNFSPHKSQTFFSLWWRKSKLFSCILLQINRY